MSEIKRTEEENTRTAGAVVGGAILGASLGGLLGAIVGGIAGAILGESVNDSNRISDKNQQNKKNRRILMDKTVLIPSVILGLILVATYVLRCWWSKSEFKNAVMVNCVFQASGIVCGSFLIAGLFSTKLRQLMTGIDIYIFVSGLAVIAVSLQGFHRDVIKSTSKKQLSESANNSLTADARTSRR